MGYFSEMDSEMSGGRRTRRDYDRLVAETYDRYEQGKSAAREAVCPCCGLSVTRHSAYDWQRCQERHR